MAVVRFIFRVYHHICQLLIFRNNRDRQSTVYFCMPPKLRMIFKGSLKKQTQIYNRNPNVAPKA